ncbi:hypothetical protein [Butyrivibrio sp. MC2013]|uniref:hypothetical protein n=1 Tax=Butyrivibrio sp. MC2013 TaxID=1280686 RepID=UPI000407ACD4|nr:hypothetical protein [Butyrivibrio sp. MC2013]
MFICMTCQDNTEKTITEICQFQGIRYDNRYKTAVISTEHSHHDYVAPMTETQYEKLVAQIAGAMNKAQVFYLKGGIVFRCRKGEIHHGADQNLTAEI